MDELKNFFVLLPVGIKGVVTWYMTSVLIAWGYYEGSVGGVLATLHTLLYSYACYGLACRKYSGWLLAVIIQMSAIVICGLSFYFNLFELTPNIMTVPFMFVVAAVLFINIVIFNFLNSNMIRKQYGVMLN